MMKDVRTKFTVFYLLFLAAVLLAQNIDWTQIRSSQRHGTGGNGQASDGTGASGNVPKFDSTGNITDSGLALSNIIISGGAAGGDLSGTYPNPGVAQVNGLAIPLSQGLIGTNASRQFVAGTCPTATTGAQGCVQPDGSTITISGGIISSSGVASLPAAGSSVTYYISTTGSDSNACTSSGSPCRTLAHVLGGQPVSLGTFAAGLIPYAITQNYIINAAHGTYTEGIYVGLNTAAQRIQIVGDAASPSSVIFNGQVGCDYIGDLSSSSTPTVFCNVGSNVSLVGVTLNGSSGNRAEMTYKAGHTALKVVNMKCLGETTDTSYCAESTTSSLIEAYSPITCDMTDSTNTNGHCIEANTNSVWTWYGDSSSDAFTISGNSSASNGSGIQSDRASLFDIHLLSGNTGSPLTITNWPIGIYVFQGASVTDKTSSANPGISITRSSGTTGVGVYVESGWYSANTGGLQLTNLSVGLQTDSNGSIFQKNCAYTNVTTHISGSSFAPSCF